MFKIINKIGNDSLFLNKKVLIRADLNVPFVNGKISDSSRIERLIPTINFLQTKGAKIIVCSHLGRPKGQVVEELSLKPVAYKLANILNKSVLFIDDCIGEKRNTKINELKKSEILLLENLRFYEEEEKNDVNFAEKLSKNIDLFINDGFSVSHRAHASTYAITKFLDGYCGINMAKELDALLSIFEKPLKPVTAIVGGAKVSTKITVLKNLIKKVDNIVIGGGMANTFLYAKGFNIGNSLCEKNLKEKAIEILSLAKNYNCKIILPVDVVVANDINDGKSAKNKNINDLLESEMILDTGEKSINEVIEILNNSKTLLWNGPLGAFEFKPFDKATTVIMKKVAELVKNNSIVSVCGGGDTVSALKNANVKDEMTYVSTAGGAFLEWIEGKELPGIEALK